MFQNVMKWDVLQIMTHVSKSTFVTSTSSFSVFVLHDVDDFSFRLTSGVIV